MTIPSAIPDIFAAFIAGDREKALKLVSHDFGVHDGLSSEEWIEHEIEEFDLRTKLLGFDKMHIEASPIAGQPGSVNFSVFTSDGRFLYEDALGVDAAGTVRGLGRNFEIVTKLAFEIDQPVKRGAALRSPRGIVTHAILLDVDVEDFWFNKGMAFEHDSFSSSQFLIHDDDHQGLQARIHLRDTSGASAIESVYLKGKNNPRFVDELYPEIVENTVRIPHRGLVYWSLSVELESGNFSVCDHPTAEAVDFPERVVTATLTDALDNDWTVRCGTTLGDGSGAG